MAQPLVSVVIPTHNRAAFIMQAIDTVRNQTYSHWELIVVDDCSTDNTAEVVENIGDDRIQLILHEKNQGGSAARNTGIKNAKGKYVAPLDSDDEWSTNKLEEQVRVAESASENIAGIYCDRKLLNPGGEVKMVENVEEPFGLTPKFLLGNFIGGASVVMLRKSALEEVGLFDVNCKAKQDTDLWLRLSIDYGFLHAPDCLVINHNEHDERISTNTDSTISGRIYFYEKHKTLLRKYDLEHVYLRKTARFIVEHGGSRSQAYKYLSLAIRRKPSYFYAYLYAFKILFLRPR
jgi:glycosyltransferase involved in cell wall biosynthesis